MSEFITTLQIILGVVLIGLILLQAKGTGLGSTFGGDIGFYSTKRGAEKLIFKTTIAIALLFFIISLLNVIV